MRKFIAFLRGVNVGGKVLLKMKDLAQAFESLGCTDVETYIQSGNVLFNTRESETEKMKNLIVKKIKEDFDLEIQVMLRSRTELRKIVERNPFGESDGFLPDKLHVTLLSAVTEKELLKPISPEKKRNDLFKRIDREIFLYCPDGYGRTVYTNNFFEKQSGVSATTRNWRTITHLLSLAEKAD